MIDFFFVVEIAMVKIKVDWFAVDDEFAVRDFDRHGGG
jgi:hypothetical protein